MGDKVLGQAVDARQSPVVGRSENRQAQVKTPGKINQDIAGVALKDVFVVKYPVGRRRCPLLQVGCGGEIGADPADPCLRFPQPFQQFNGTIRP